MGGLSMQASKQPETQWFSNMNMGNMDNYVQALSAAVKKMGKEKYSAPFERIQAAYDNIKQLNDTVKLKGRYEKPPMDHQNSTPPMAVSFSSKN
jgi:hypothetical protein